MTAPVVLPARLDSASAQQLTRALLDRQGADVVLDASGVDLIGARALQALLVAAAAWRAAGHAFAVAHLSQAARQQLATLGLRDLSLLEGAAP